MNTATLRDIAEARGLVGGPFGSSLVSRDYVPAGVPVIRGENLNHGRRVGGDFVYVSPEKFARDLSRNSAQEGDLIFTQRGTLGQVAIVENPPHDTYVVSQSQMRLRVNRSVADPLYVYYACSSPEFLRQIEDRAISTGVPHINLGILGSLRLRLPELAEQRAIAEVLGALDDKIAANTRLAATADELAQSILRSSLDGTVAPLSEVAQLVMGSSPPGDTYNDSGIGVAFFQGVRDFGVRTPTRRIWTTSPTRLAEKGDILLSVRAPVGRTNFASETSCIGRGVAAVRAKNGHQKTLFHSLRAAPEVWSPFEAEGTVFGSVTRSQLERVLVPVVAGSEVDRVEFTLASIEGRVEAALEENMTLAATRDALLPALMSGKLRVRDAQSIVGDLA